MFWSFLPILVVCRKFAGALFLALGGLCFGFCFELGLLSGCPALSLCVPVPTRQNIVRAVDCNIQDFKICDFYYTAKNSFLPDFVLVRS